MPSLLSTSEISVLTGSFGDGFDTFVRTIFVNKEPLATPIAGLNQNDMVFGFGENQSKDAFTYTPVSKAFQATVRYGARQPEEVGAQSNVIYPVGGVSIKVRRDCRDYINDGKTESITIDDRNFVIADSEKFRSFLTSEYWVFNLEARN